MYYNSCSGVKKRVLDAYDIAFIMIYPRLDLNGEGGGDFYGNGEPAVPGILGSSTLLTALVKVNAYYFSTFPEVTVPLL